MKKITVLFALTLPLLSFASQKEKCLKQFDQELSAIYLEEDNHARSFVKDVISKIPVKLMKAHAKAGISVAACRGGQCSSDELDQKYRALSRAKHKVDMKIDELRNKLLTSNENYEIYKPYYFLNSSVARVSSKASDKYLVRISLDTPVISPGYYVDSRSGKITHYAPADHKELDVAKLRLSARAIPHIKGSSARSFRRFIDRKCYLFLKDGNLRINTKKIDNQRSSRVIF